MNFDTKKYLDSAGLTHLWQKIESELSARDTTIDNEVKRATGVEGSLTDLTTEANTSLVAAINEVDAHIDAEVTARTEKIGDIGDVTVKSFIETKISEVNSDTSALTNRVKANEDAIITINGEGDGSIKKAAADAVTKVVASAPENFDTLKEVADWIANDTTGAAKMQADIATLTGTDTVTGSVAKSIKDAIEALDAEKSQDAGADGLALNIIEVDGKITAISGSIAANTYDAYGTGKSAYDAIVALSTTEIDSAIAAGKVKS